MNNPTEYYTNLVKKLREESGFGLIDCAKALALNDFNYDEAINALKIKGLAVHFKKQGDKNEKLG
jgi:translation elongation factor EF-Ts